MLDNKEFYSPIYGSNISINNDINKENCERYNSFYKEMKLQEMKLLHKDIIELSGKLYKFSDSLENNNEEELGIKEAIFEALQNLNYVTEYLTEYTLSGE